MTTELCNRCDCVGSVVKGQKRTVWLFKDAEPLPIDGSGRPFRMSLLAEKLLQQGDSVVWFTSRFDHTKKEFRQHKDTINFVSDDFQIILLDGPGYRRNISLARILHQRSVSRHFREICQTLAKPDCILAAYPSPEFCDEARRYATNFKIPYYVDVRDPWPDVFLDYFPRAVSWMLWPLLYFYRKKLGRCVSAATGVFSMSRRIHDWALAYGNRERQSGDKVFYLGYKSATTRADHSIPAEGFSPQDPLRCVFTGFFSASYDVGTIIRSAKRFQDEGNASVFFVVVGDGEFKESYIEQAKGLTNIEFTGFLPHDKLKAVLETCHVGLVPLSGGLNKVWLGNKLFEYASAGLTIVSTVPGEARELIEAHEFGEYIEEGSDLQLKDAVDRLLANPNLLHARMNNARQTYERLFSADAIYSDYAQELCAQS